MKIKKRTGICSKKYKKQSILNVMSSWSLYNTDKSIHIAHTPWRMSLGLSRFEQEMTELSNKGCLNISHIWIIIDQSDCQWEYGLCIWYSMDIPYFASWFVSYSFDLECLINLVQFLYVYPIGIKLTRTDLFYILTEGERENSINSINRLTLNMGICIYTDGMFWMQLPLHVPNSKDISWRNWGMLTMHFFEVQANAHLIPNALYSWNPYSVP